MHKPIVIKDLEISFLHTFCLSHCNVQIQSGDRIAIIGRNGTGKSTLLKILAGLVEPAAGRVVMPENIVIGYVPQIIEEFDSYSGAERFQKSLNQALALDPDVLLLDEPTNHLDQKKKKNLLRMLQNYQGTLIIVSHDAELLSTTVDTIWRIEQGRLHQFRGGYQEYMMQQEQQRSQIEQQLHHLKKQKKEMHEKLMSEQERSAKSTQQGKKKIATKKVTKMEGGTLARAAERTAGKKLKGLDEQKQGLIEQLHELALPEIILPTFSLSTLDFSDRVIISIQEGTVGYTHNTPIVTQINLTLAGTQRIALMGENGSGKSTIIKGILSDSSIIKTGTWQLPAAKDIGYLDQQYKTLIPTETVLETMSRLAPQLTHAEIRRYLNDFLFRTNEEVSRLVNHLSGGEKARLSLACIGIKTPRLLLLDEITNNLDRETRQHVIEVIKAYPGALIVISHDDDFLQKINIDHRYTIADGCCTY